MLRKRLHARMFWALTVLSTAVSGCLGKGRVVVEECGFTAKYSAPAYYAIVNNTKQTISVDHLYRIQVREECKNADRYHSQNNSILPGSTYYGPLVDPLYTDGWFDERNAKISFAPTTLIAIRLDQNTIAYYTGYPKSLSKELSSWLTANQSHLDPSFYTPMPTADIMDVYGLFYIAGNTGRILLGLPPARPELPPGLHDIYTSLDLQDRPHRPADRYRYERDFLITFTVNGLKKDDIVLSYEGKLRE